jgi:monothiol glutaredoxin
MIHSRSILLVALIACVLVAATTAFTTATTGSRIAVAVVRSSAISSSTSLSMSFDDFGQETPEDTKERIQALVENNPVLLFMKGSKLFPQCGFSNTACQILQSYDIDFHSIDVLSDEAIRTGVKDFSMWPTIPQLYVVRFCFVGVLVCVRVVRRGSIRLSNHSLTLVLRFLSCVAKTVRRIHRRIGHYDRDVPERRAR